MRTDDATDDMTEDELLLGLDAGTSTIKAVLLDRAGCETAVASRPTPFAATPAGTEMSVGALTEALDALLDALGPSRARVAAVGIAGLGESGAPLGSDGAPLAPVIAWHDPRGAEAVEQLERTFGPSLALRIGQRPRTVSSVAKLGWLTAHGVEAAAVHRWLGVAELCLRRLTGECATEHSLACRTGCYDVVRREWLPDVVRAAGVSAAIFPAVRTAGEPMGTLIPEAARRTGLPPGVPVTLAGHDHLAGAVGAGALSPDLVNSVGTAETVLRRLPGLPDLERAVELRAAVSVRPGADGWSVMTGAARAGVVLGRAAAALGSTQAELDRRADGAHGLDPEAADRLVRAVQERADAVLPRGQPGDVWRGLLEALSRRMIEAASRLEVLTGPPARVLVVGGGSRSRLWLDLKARQSPYPLAVPAVAEAASRGAALLAGVAAGWWPSAEAAPAPPAERHGSPGVSPAP